MSTEKHDDLQHQPQPQSTHECQFCSLQGDGLTLSRHRKETQHLIRLIADRERYTAQPRPQEDKAVELKLCPFCGTEPVLSTMTVTPNAFKVRCNFCWARSGDHKDSETAANAWNTRAYNPTETDDGLSLADAVAIARGCFDYGGGYRSDDAKLEIYRHGIQTVVAALEAAERNGLNDLQVKTLHSIGYVAPTDQSVDAAKSTVAAEGCDRKDGEDE